MNRAVSACLFVLTALGVLMLPGGRSAAQSPSPGRPWVIAHRGASAYAPENTIPAFELAAQQGATFVEFDLQLTRDKQIVCLHDTSLERTTDVEQVFPDRAREPAAGSTGRRTWMLEDFTLGEIKRLDAGAWFDARYRGTRVPTFGETIEALRGRAGLFIEVKAPERYEGIERAIMAELRRRGLDRLGADPRTPVLLQSFSASSLQIFAGSLKTTLPIHYLFGAKDAGQWLTADGLRQVKTFATGLSPEKTALGAHPEGFARARELGLPITPYTFRSSAVTGFADVTAEMRHYLQTWKVDGLITDNPDLAPR